MIKDADAQNDIAATAAELHNAFGDCAPEDILLRIQQIDETMPDASAEIDLRRVEVDGCSCSVHAAGGDALLLA